MRLQLKVSVGLITLVIALSLASGDVDEPDSISDDLHLEAAQSKFRVSNLFNFSSYKKLFNKSYSNLSEELLRQKLFWARAFRAVISAVKYKTGQQKYYLAINQMSDMTPEEIQRMINDAHDGLQPAMEAKEPDLIMDGLEEEDGNEPAGVRSMNQAEGLEQETEKEVLNEVPSSSEVSGTSKVSDSLTISQWERVVIQNIKSSSAAEAPQLKRPKGLGVKFREGWRKAFKKKDIARLPLMRPAPDEVFLDLRDTKCFDLPRFQGVCGACYAFVMTAILEWLYCMKSGQLVKFSEQYMIDCGYDNIDTLDGCIGGNAMAAASFIRNFGIELHDKWPYRMREHECPYNEDTLLETTGYFRFPLPELLAVHLDMVPKHLESGPLYVSLMTTPDFAEYGGGVHGFGCSPTIGTHAMTLVGHGREKGEEYWLLRNSFGPAWGEGGYYKMAKSADCIKPPRAYEYGSIALINESDFFAINKLRDENIVKRHYNETTVGE